MDKRGRGRPKTKFTLPSEAKELQKKGLPEKSVDLDQVLYWIDLQATQEEIAGSFRIHLQTLNRVLEESFGMNFSQLKERAGGTGKLTLRRHQLKLSETNAAMAIWLGKCWLGQTDVTEAYKESTKQRELDLSYENGILRNKLREAQEKISKIEGYEIDSTTKSAE